MLDLDLHGYRLAAVMAQQRSGTHFLGSCLGSHPDVKYTGEIFCRNVPQTWEQLVKMLDRVVCDECKVVVLDTKYNQINPLMEQLLERPEVTVIHLLRKDLLRLYFSGEVHSWRGQPGNKDHIPVFKFNDPRYREIVQARRECIEQFSYLEDLRLVYEDLTANQEVPGLPEWASRQICDLLGVEFQMLTTGCRKEAPVDFRKHLEGYECVM